ncbi:hypothetical protein EJF36_08540 [Bacillus sp. HMF5848]|uniref:YlbE-like family protein n=1 Tax=Bacillus sp. HMF5848 TaxID=2495421 RepID=UPI000F7A3AD0|nr:YlbE-like family protein [Bacillus sp. HMF5848]RSK26912.1 hypothetical protein EJF36_08540 [Bacillus sp. HMF5848]
MREEVYTFLKSNKEIKKFVRTQPQWYRHLLRRPTETDKLQLAAMQYYKKTIPDKVEQFSQSINMATMMMQMFRMMREKD